MNLLGLKKIGGEQKLTLDKLNREIRTEAKSNNLNLSIMQSHNEAKVVSHIQKNRSKIDGIIITPGPWQLSAFVLKDLLELTKIPFITITYKENEKVILLKGLHNINNSNIYKSFEEAIKQL